MEVPTEKLREHLQKQVLDALYSRSPADSDELRLRPVGDVEASPVRYYLYVDVVRELAKAARYRSTPATAVLMGRFCIDERGPFIEVSAFQGLEYLYGADRFDRTRSILEEILDENQDKDRHRRRHVVGVFCSRPGTKARLDRELARLHLSLFNLPYQMALVIDGDEQRLGLYARGENTTFFNPAFYVVDKVREGTSDREAAESEAKRDADGPPPPTDDGNDDESLHGDDE